MESTLAKVTLEVPSSPFQVKPVDTPFVASPVGATAVPVLNTTAFTPRFVPNSIGSKQTLELIELKQRIPQTLIVSTHF